MLLALKDAFYGFIMVFIVSLRELATTKLLQSASFYIMSLYIDCYYQQVVMVLAVVFIERLPIIKLRKNKYDCFTKCWIWFGR